MRISDWSTDVCSSELVFRILRISISIIGPRPATPQVSSNFRGSTSPREEGSGGEGSGRNRTDDCGLRAFSAASGAVMVARRSVDQHQHGGASTMSEFLTGHTERSEEHTSELQSLMRTSYAVFCLKKKNI